MPATLDRRPVTESILRRDLEAIGVERGTALHFAESLVEKRRVTTVRFPRLEAGERRWVELPNVADDNDRHFPNVGAQFLATGRATSGRVGEAQAFYFRMRDLVGVARAYFERML